MSRRDNSSGKKFSGRQGGSGRKKSYARGNAPIKPKNTALEKREDGMRLNKYIANAGICSRRDADIYIASGNVSVNGEVVTEMGYKVQLTDEVKFDGRSITPDKPEYFVLNKSKGVFVTGSVHKGGLTVMDIMAKASKSKLDPIGKLDTQTTGLLVFTNDGALAKKLANPKNGIRQIYHIKLDHALSQGDLEKIREGVFIEGKKVNTTDISYVKDRPKSEVGMEITSTRSHIVQKIFKSLGYEILNLDRVVYGGLTKKDLPRGRFRTLTKQEVINLGNL
ncbi:rRNA pseudouridine synthase [Zunongwangia sp. SCSIO 43204]|uniref:23S rRNA pseudouridine2605 synthase n=1 Tax=Zunongwangia mangrovi TaxID=1334022 RepID=A0A1I1EJ69_9FLAO|nr:MULTISPECIES: pseudouridine synthase [Zunongwangia]UAB85742.1 rRNA pseudouridine synthase [Zunongwangia sp. SCSIO 43204]SFB86736.1 23S rRNA pseudouridine2605 synthase [Zunongwangia mangrovi]